MNLDVSVFPEPADMTNHGDDALSSRTGAPDGDDRLSEDRSLLQQRLAVRELIDTEVSYLHVLQLCASDIRSRLQQVPGWDHTQLVFREADMGPASETSHLFLGQA